MDPKVLAMKSRWNTSVISITKWATWSSSAQNTSSPSSGVKIISQDHPSKSKFKLKSELQGNPTWFIFSHFFSNPPKKKLFVALFPPFSIQFQKTLKKHFHSSHSSKTWSVNFLTLSSKLKFQSKKLYDLSLTIALQIDLCDCIRLELDLFQINT